MLLYRTIFALTLGRSSSSPYASSFRRFIIILIAASVLGWLIRQSIPPLPAIKISQSTAFFATIFLSYFLTVLTLLVSRGATTSGQSTPSNLLLATLPLKPLQQKIVHVLPATILAACSLALLSWPLSNLASKAGLSVPLIIIALANGASCAIGIVCGIRSKRWLLPIAIVTLWIQIKLLQAIASDSASSSEIFLTLYILLLLILSLLPWIGTRDVLRLPYQASVPIKNWSSWLPGYLFFFKKILRSSLTRLSFITTLSISFTIAAWSIKTRTFIGPVLLQTGTLLLAAFATDIRALCARQHPPEIFGLRGTIFYLKHMIMATAVIGILSVFPLILVYIFYTSDGYMSLLNFMVFGLSTGIFASVLVAPGPRDIAAQCLSAGLAILLLVCQSSLSSFAADYFAAIQIGATILLLSLACLIEYKRNPYIWRPRKP